jgi:hypothetical protein
MASAPSLKQTLIDKTNARIVLFTGIAAFIFMFSAVATKTLISQAAYQNRVISAKRATVNQLKTDITSSNQLKASYGAFIGTSQNVIGGLSGGSGNNDGNNAQIILDALPSGYDFPGLATSLSSLLSSQGVTISSITGTDDEVAQSTNQSSSDPQPVAIPFTVAVTGDYTGVQNVINTFEKSIRPIQIQNMTISGSNSTLSLNVGAQTYYQPAKSLSITQEAVK